MASGKAPGVQDCNPFTGGMCFYVSLHYFTYSQYQAQLHSEEILSQGLVLRSELDRQKEEALAIERANHRCETTYFYIE